MKSSGVWGQRARVVHSRLCVLCATCIIALFGVVPNAAAQSDGRGEVGVDLHAMWVGTGGQLLWFGASAWYRLEPAIALGLSAESNLVTYGGEGILLDGSAGIQGGAKILKAFVDYRLAPKSPFGAYARFSLGVADVQPVYPNGGTSGGRWGAAGPELITELAAGPEFRLFLSSKPEAPRPALFLRFGGSLTLMAPRAFGGAMLTLGGEG